MTNVRDDRGAELRDLFFETSQELLQALNEEALKLDGKNKTAQEALKRLKKG